MRGPGGGDARSEVTWRGSWVMRGKAGRQGSHGGKANRQVGQVVKQVREEEEEVEEGRDFSQSRGKSVWW